MKRSLLFAIAVLLIAALFVSCNANKVEEDQLVEVKISAEEARALEVSGTLDVDVENLYWFYTAEKLGGIFKVGEHKELYPVNKAIDGETVTPQKGLQGVSLGKMSTGPWEFYFYGFNSPDDITNLDNAIYQQKALRISMKADTTLNVALERGKGALPDARIGFSSDGITWMMEGVPTDLTSLKLMVYDGETTILPGEVTGVYDTDLEKYVFSLTGTAPLSDGPHTLTAEVVYSYTDDITKEIVHELVGRTILNVVAEDGMLYVVSDVTGTPSGVDVVDPELIDVEIGVPTKPLEATTVVAASTAAQTVSTNVSPAGAATGATLVTFPANSLYESSDVLKLDVITYSIVNAPAKFVVTDETAVVAGVDLTLTKNDVPVTTFNEKMVIIETHIAKNLEDVRVYYGDSEYIPDTAEKYFISYDPGTGVLKFQTPHFSEFYVSSKPYAKIGNKYYGTLETAFDAVQNGETITLLDNYIVSAEKTATTDRIIIDKAITIDFGENKLIVPGELEPTANWAALYVDADTTFEATTGGIECRDKVSGGCGVYAVNVRNGATLTINGGYYHGGGTAIQVQLGKAIINDGEIWATNYEEPYNNGFVLNCIDSAYNAGNASFEVCGGTFRYFNPADNVAESANTNFVAEGFVSIPVEEEVNTWTVVPAVATIGAKDYATLESAIAAVPENVATVITLIGKRIEFTGYYATIPSSKIITIDLNGNIVEAVCTSEGTSALIRNLGTLTLTDSSAAGTGKLAVVATPSWIWDGTENYAGSYASNLIRNEGTLIIESGIYENSTGGSAAYAIDNYGTGKVTINGGELTTTKASAIRYFYTNDGSTLTVSGGKIGGTSSFMGVQLMGNASSKAIVNLKGGEFTGSYAVSAPYGTVTINDGTYNGIVGFGTTSYSPVIVIAIKGGVFNGSVTSWSSSVDNFITGGIFTENPIDYVAENLATHKNADGTYSIVDAHYLVSVSEDVWVSATLSDESKYVDMYGFWAMNAAGCVDADGNQCPRYVSVNDETPYRDVAVELGKAEDYVSGKYLFENYLAEGKSYAGQYLVKKDGQVVVKYYFETEAEADEFIAKNGGEKESL